MFIIRSQKQTKLNSEKRVYVDANNNSKNKNKENCLLDDAVNELNRKIMLVVVIIMMMMDTTTL